MSTVDTPDSLARFKFFTPVRVVWGDMDSMRHVNNTKYFYYCETARLDFFHELDEKFGASEAQILKGGIALAETGCRFKVSLTFPDTLLIGSAIESIEDTQFKIIHHIYSEKLDCIAAEANARMVMFDRNKGRRVKIPDEYVSVLKAYMLAE